MKWHYVSKMHEVGGGGGCWEGGDVLTDIGLEEDFFR